MTDPRTDKLAAFTAWAAAHVSGDEKGEAHIFLDHLLQAFGQPGSLEIGEHEFRIRKAGEDGGGTSFADFVWKPVVLIEMKKRGVNLAKHYRQAFDYWTRLVPGRPRYVILCNFDEFHVYDFETQMDSPVGTVALADLPEHHGPLNFLFPGQPAPRFENDRVAVTREAADCLADCFKKLRQRGVDQPTAQRFILQILVSLFAEDIDLLPKYFVSELLNEISSPADSYDLLGGLFTAMNTSPAPSGGRFKGVAYFNGGLFNVPARIELQDLELVALRKAATYDWKKVQPEIFGTLFEHSLDDGSVAGTKDERRATGAHFTNPADIMKIVGPTIVEPWREQIEGAKTLRRLGELRERMHSFRVLDPACGSGNFLYVAYRELKRLEARIIERINAEFPSRAEPGQIAMSYLSAQNFFGLDVNPFAVEIAKVTMMIARKLAIDELHIAERALPLDNLDQNFRATDALVVEGIAPSVLGGSAKRPVFLFISRGFRPSNLIQVFGFADDYSFGVLQSHAHWLWFVTKCGKLKSDFRYSAESVFDTFPWPQFTPPSAAVTDEPVPTKSAAAASEAHGKLAGGVSHRTPPTKTDAPQRGAGSAPDETIRRPAGADEIGDAKSGGSRHRLISAEPPAPTSPTAHSETAAHGDPAAHSGPAPTWDRGTLSAADLARIEAVAAAGREVRRIRAEALPKMRGGLRALYRTLELPGANPLKAAHAALDAAVLAAYGFSPKADLLAQLLALNQQVTARITAPANP